MHRPGVFTNAEEDMAALFLRLSGIAVVARNARRFGAEIDVLGHDPARGEYLFCEVKRRRHGESARYPLLSRAQQRRLKDSALALIADARKFLPVRICLLIVDVKKRTVEVVPDIVHAD